MQTAIQLFNAGEYESTEATLREILAENNNDSNAWSLLALTLWKRGDFAGAEQSFQTSLQIEPRNAVTLCNYGQFLVDRSRYEEAERVLKETIGQLKLYPGADEWSWAMALTKVYENLAFIVNKKEVEEAKTDYENMIRDNPGNLNIRMAFAEYLSSKFRYAEAAKVLASVAKKCPLNFYVESWRRMRLDQVCDWKTRSIDNSRIFKNIGNPNIKIPAFAFTHLYRTDDPNLLRRAAEEYVAKMVLPKVQPKRYTYLPSRPDGRIRMGFVSANLHNHPVAFLMAEMFELFDREKFELTAYSLWPDDQSPMRNRLEHAFDRFNDCKQMSDEQIADSINRDGIDIAIDLMWLTGSQQGIFVNKPAPVQVNYLGFTGTTGSPYMDYIVGDSIVIPEWSEKNFTEQVIRVSGTFQANDRQRKVAAGIPTRSEVGLPEDTFVYMCFNQNYKITPEIFNEWMRILKEVPNSVLWLLKMEEAANRNIHNEAMKRWIDKKRIIFAGWTSNDQHVARIPCADLVLDTFPYNAHTTTSDALWMGVPVLTRMGRSFASRVAASLLSAAGIPEFITQDIESYRARAIEIGRDPDSFRAKYKNLIVDTRKSRLFDTPALTRNFEHLMIDIHTKRNRAIG